MTDDTRYKASGAKTGGAIGATAVIAAAVAFVAPYTAEFEGFKPKPYWDPAHIRTYCYGETENVEERVYERTECAALLRRRLARDYGPKVYACIPTLQDPRRKVLLGAAIDSSYNAGPVAVCKSSWAGKMRAGRFAEGCAGIRGWYVTALNRKTGVRSQLPGLVKRRILISNLCTKAL